MGEIDFDELLDRLMPERGRRALRLLSPKDNLALAIRAGGDLMIPASFGSVGDADGERMLADHAARILVLTHTILTQLAAADGWDPAVTMRHAGVYAQAVSCDKADDISLARELLEELVEGLANYGDRLEQREHLEHALGITIYFIVLRVPRDRTP